MRKGLLDPKVDFVFKNIFGSEKHPEILISFLNAILQPVEQIVEVEIKGTDIAKHFIEDKYSRLDIKAVTSNKEIINIEIQLKNEHNMVKRSLYYLSKMYEEQLGEGDDYASLKRTICINILNFKYLKTEAFHTGYRLKEIQTNEELTDVIEMHFIEIPKLPKDSDETDMLVAWTEFLKDPESEKVRNLELTIQEVREAKSELIRMSNNEEQRAMYEMRAKILKDKVSALNKAREEGEVIGIEKVARALLDVLDDKMIAKKTGLSEEEIAKLRQEL
ncbi:MAG: Rpn family recombination-promoting nuclease/putative transposase [Cellulosilyticaceae bacterium]